MKDLLTFGQRFAVQARLRPDRIGARDLDHPVWSRHAGFGNTMPVLAKFDVPKGLGFAPAFLALAVWDDAERKRRGLA